ncbi:MAG: hypothetical protein ABI666_04675 [Ferruginibacter sp.]
MLKKILLPITLFTSLLACNSETKKAPVTDVEVATTFVRDILDNRFDEAGQFLLKDETNSQIFERFQKQYSTKDKKILEQYKAADIIVNEISYVTDTICIFNYSNSYSKDVKTKLKVVRVNKKWLIDLQYTFSGNL